MGQALPKDSEPAGMKGGRRGPSAWRSLTLAERDVLFVLSAMCKVRAGRMLRSSLRQQIQSSWPCSMGNAKSGQTDKAGNLSYPNTLGGLPPQAQQHIAVALQLWQAELQQQ